MQSLFKGKWTPFWLSLPMLFIVAMFFYLPIYLSFWWSFTLERPFGGGSSFVGLQNYIRVLTDPVFWDSLWRTALFMVIGSSLAIAVPLVVALAADRKVGMSTFARNIMLWPKGISGASVGVVFSFIFNPFVGIFRSLNELSPGLWQPGNHGTDAFITLLVAHVWSGIPFSFVILLSGLQAVPRDMIRAAAIDGASPWRRIWDIQLPMIAPQLFLTFVIEFTDSIVSVFSLIDTMTQGGPGGSTRLLVYKIYQDGFVGYDLSGAATQTVILMVIVLALAAVQFLVIEKRVRYER